MESIPAGIPETRGRGLTRGEGTQIPAVRGERRREALRVFVVCWLVYVALWSPYIVREQRDFEPTTKSLEPPVLRLLKFGTLYQTVGKTFSTKIRLHPYSVDPHA